MKAQLCKATLRELDDVYDIYRSVIGKNGCAWNDLYPTREDIGRDYSSQCLYLYKNNGEIYGAVSLLPQNELDGFSLWKYKNAVEFARVVIKPEYQGHGLAKVMLLELFEIIKKDGKASGCKEHNNTACEALHISVAVENQSAKALYRSLGFTFIERCHLYSNDYWLCERRLSAE